MSGPGQYSPFDGRMPASDPRANLHDAQDLVQLLTPEGERVPNAEYDSYIDALTPEEIRGLYRDLVLVRRIDAEATALQRQGELGLWAALLGQEAAQVGAGRAMRGDDVAFPTYREHGVAYCMGVDPVNLLGMFRGVNNGGWDPAALRFNLYTIVIGSQTLHATGYAMGIQRDGLTGHDDSPAVVAFHGDGATSQGDVNEAYIFSAVFDAPVVFFCQNNQWAISEPLERQTRVPLYQRASGFGFPGIRVDGNDVLATYAVTRAALEQCGRGEGPVLVEAFTYRMGAHTTSDDPTRYRLSADLEAWKLKDPLERMKSYLVRSGLADADFLADVAAAADEMAHRVRTAVLEMPDPAGPTMFDDIYTEAHPRLVEQKAEFIAYHSGFAPEPATGSARVGH
jgi:2-oxoisovalerate dehydrogenase E1 component alpha subunit